MSDLIEQTGTSMRFTEEPWVILSKIEQSIKEKIEKYGVPLKDWDIDINYGIKTGCNEAFIIDEAKRAELIQKDPKSAEIIRPILRGRDIKKYGYEFANLYLICTFPSKHYNIEQYPAIKDWLINGDWVLPKSPIGTGMLRLEQTGSEHTIEGVKFKSRKKTSNKWFETQDSISYWDDYSTIKKQTSWKGGSAAWGNHRIWLEPANETNTLNRSNFSIHGGVSFGSAGCIDLENGMDGFAKWFEKNGKDVIVHVKY